ncbi:MAG: hypothetical protein KA764_11550 [Anaerolineales bacterium]|nr:hypothetical protein [Anaerolineales bacterium]
MAAAVAEAHRVLARGGMILDIHPTAEWPKFQIWAEQRRPLGRLELAAEDERSFAAASAALAAAPDLRPAVAQIFDYRYEFDSLDELTDFLDDNPEFARASDDLLERATTALAHTPGPAKLVMLQAVAITVLRKP